VLKYTDIFCIGYSHIPLSKARSIKIPKQVVLWPEELMKFFKLFFFLSRSSVLPIFSAQVLLPAPSYVFCQFGWECSNICCCWNKRVLIAHSLYPWWLANWQNSNWLFLSGGTNFDPSLAISFHEMYRNLLSFRTVCLSEVWNGQWTHGFSKGTPHSTVL